MLPVETAFKIYVGIDGKPLDNGYVYFGQPNQNPITSPVTVYWDAAGTQPAAQPLRTLNGYIVRNGTPANVFYSGAYSQLVQDKKKQQVYFASTSDDYSIANTVTNFISNLGSSTGASLVGFIQLGVNAIFRTVLAKLRESKSTGDWGVTGDGVTDDLAKINNAFTDTPQRGLLRFPQATAYKISNTVQIFDKAGAVLDFGNQQINASTFSGLAKTALMFQAMSEASIKDIYLIGSTTFTSEGVFFSAASGKISIHMVVDKIRVANCQVGVLIGVPTYQVSDSNFKDIYASDCTVAGIRLTGENTLAMRYGRVAAFNNSAIGVHIDQGGGSIDSLQTGSNGTDLYFGASNGTNHGKLARWDIFSGYSEEGIAGERFIDSATCTDTNPFKEQVVINGFRCTPFSSTNVADFIRWRLNGDLILRDVTVAHGQQLPYISVDHNGAFRAPKVLFEGTIDCQPGPSPQVPMTYMLTDNRQQVEINAEVNNGMTFWQNNGAVAEGTMKRGIYMRKMADFERALLAISGLVGAWTLADITSGNSKNLVLGMPSLIPSAPLERRDFWLDDGLIGFFRNSTTSKTISTTSVIYAAASEYTFGAILRPTATGSSEESTTTLGGALGIRISVYNGALLCIVGGANAFTVPTNPYDPHLVIGRYTSGTSIKVDAINLRTGEILSASTVAGVPAFGALTWVNGISLRNDHTVRGCPFVYNRALSDIETKGLLQSSLRLTSSWRF